jgi:hypothetical protein
MKEARIVEVHAALENGLARVVDDMDNAVAFVIIYTDVEQFRDSSFFHSG